MRGTIAVGVSEGMASSGALHWAMRRALRTGAEVVLVHVLGEPRTETASSKGDRLLERELQAARAMSPEAVVRVRSLQGSVMWQLVAASDDFDLIVVGTHKTGFIHGSVYGSTSLALAATAACPVVVVPGAIAVDPEGVLVGADDSAAGRAALRFAAAEADSTDQVLSVLRASPDLRDAPDDAAERDAADRLLSDLTVLAGTGHPGLAVHRRRLHGSTAESLVLASAACRLLVLGDSRTGSIDAPALGAVCHDALMNIRVPTAIVHAGDMRAFPGEPQDAVEVQVEPGRPVLAPAR